MIEHDPSQKVAKMLSKMTESESLWYAIVNACDHQRVDVLSESMIEHFTLLMAGEENCNVSMSVISFVSRYIVMMSKQGEISLETATMMMQMGLQRGANAHIAADKIVKQNEQ